MKFFVTGGLGFIGSNLSRKLLNDGHQVTIIDSLSEQVHGDDAINLVDDFKTLGAKVIVDDVLNCGQYEADIFDAESLIHLAAETGTSQSMYQMKRYVETNCVGTAALFDVLINNRDKLSLKNFVLASSRSIYGEGAYVCSNHGISYPESRVTADLASSVWGFSCKLCGSPLESIATDESSRINSLSLYAHTKFSQEDIVRIGADALGVNYKLLRFQNVYGAGQSLKNPYTGILSIFANRLKQNIDLPLFEDGEMARDFVYITDVVNGICLASRSLDGDYNILNIGSGVASKISNVVRALIGYHPSSTSNCYVSAEYRVGDIRSCYADIRLAERVLGYQPKVSLNEGLAKFMEWAIKEDVYEDGLSRANKVLKEKGLMK
jgi:dTDP-L-rhamnose 4-epimerase